jgi:23S rRNA (cytosine1962-C5)-methyltransferase
MTATAPRGDAASLLFAAPDRGAVAPLTRDLRRDLRRGHPWVFADAVRLPEGLTAGEVVTVRGKDGRPIGKGYADPGGPLAVRILTTESAAGGARALSDLLAARLDRALALRQSLFGGPAANITGYRVINGEGDGLPGLVVDRYGDVLVVKPDGPIAEAFWDLETVARALGARTGVANIYLRTRSRGGAEGRTLLGEVPDLVSFQEGPARFSADVVHGQKTGFFLDQREHRLRIGAMARGRRVLNAFGYTGGFSVHAGLGGALEVATVDQAGPAIAHAKQQWRDNGLPKDRHEGIAADAFAFLESAAAAGRRWDLIVLDPPAFAPSRKQAPQALAAYKKMVAFGAAVAAPDALVLVASCSAHVSLGELTGVIEEGVAEVKKKADVICFGGQPPDHPYPLACPELAYLKAVYLRLS